MKKIGEAALALVLCLPAFSGPAVAHHSFAMFDQTKITKLKNVTVVRFEWTNQHVFVVVQSGGTTYTLEGSSPAQLKRTGWKFNMLQAGERIDVAFNPLRSGKPGGSLKLVTLSDGRKLEAG